MTQIGSHRIRLSRAVQEKSLRSPPALRFLTNFALGIHPNMGRKAFFAKQDEIAKEKRCIRVEDTGYVFGAHADEDPIRDKDKRLPNTKNMYRKAANLWMKFVKQHGIEGYESKVTNRRQSVRF